MARSSSSAEEVKNIIIEDVETETTESQGNPKGNKGNEISLELPLICGSEEKGYYFNPMNNQKNRKQNENLQKTIRSFLTELTHKAEEDKDRIFGQSELIKTLEKLFKKCEINISEYSSPIARNHQFTKQIMNILFEQNILKIQIQPMQIGEKDVKRLEKTFVNAKMNISNSNNTNLDTLSEYYSPSEEQIDAINKLNLK